MSTDSDIIAAVSRELATDPHLDAGDIVVDMFGGAITLNGTVASQAQSAAATAAAQRVDGVTRVDNLWPSPSRIATTGTTRRWHSWRTKRPRRVAPCRAVSRRPLVRAVSFWPAR